MPRTKLDKPKYPPINQLRAAILERKFVGDFSWEDLGRPAGMTGDAFRMLFNRKPPEDCPSEVRNAVCRHLDIRVNISVTGE